MPVEAKAIQFFSDNIEFTLRDKTKLRRFILWMFKIEKKAVESLNYVFSDDKFIRKLNRKFLNHDYNTDILTFSMNASSPIQAEIYISVERVKANSHLYNSHFKEELLRVIFHGALHLCGYKDKSVAQRKKMQERENHYLKLYESFT